MEFNFYLGEMGYNNFKCEYLICLWTKELQRREEVAIL